ncbi:hypothetical protein M406DRAFT_108039 [Cryphonectria parasitica EP155]|uniref:non-specific serine/threonine protein kinase n=1 Tax=Cryphonectria parasitica (strain ATCC 38755 / EP155) TaxID=660469 RepID=A0A9P4XXT2_CRYP1|nr:uncharacterized protein M406DRAFT_108039 [Cryphonectria parasitica EP155]KAF3762973.1 hypothetical protein M406DRAFT_108039 [Cryphonectria parasitica EP155]
MLRRPPTGEGRPVVQQRKKLWALAALLLPWAPVVDAADLHHHHHEHQQSLDRHPQAVISPWLDAAAAAEHGLDRKPEHERSPLEADRVKRNLAATALTHDLIQTPHAALRRKSTYSQPIQAQKEPSRHEETDLDPFHDLVSTDASAISAAAPDLSVVAPSARRLEDWEVEDFVLLATIDGDLYATDRKSGRERWHISLGQPMVETTHHRINRSSSAAGADFNLVEAAPSKNEALSLVYTGEKKTVLLTLDAATGRAIKWFGPTASAAADDSTCARPQDTVAGLDVEECNTRTITLGRTEYTVGISDARGYDIATLKYSEWTPNLFDQDLLGQYSSTLDKLYITSRPDGRAYAFEYGRDTGRSQSFVQYFPSPIAKAFDIVRPIRSFMDDAQDNPQLVALPQPPPPPAFEHQEPGRESKIFLNNTAGNWFAMSGLSYPLITQAPSALINQVQWWEVHDDFSTAQLTKALVGQHTLDSAWSKPGQHRLPTLPGSQNLSPKLDNPSDPDNPTLAIDAPDPSSTVIDIVKKLPQDALQHTTDLFTNPAIWLILAIALVVYRKEFIRFVRNGWHEIVSDAKNYLKRKGFEVDVDDDLAEDTPETERVEARAAEKDRPSAADTALEAPVERSVPPLPPLVSQEDAVPLPEEGKAGSTEENEQGQPETKKKKAHRGRRGGKNHKKKKTSPDASVGDVPDNSVDEAVDIAKNIGERSRGPEPNIQTLPYEVEDVSNPILRIDESLEVNEDQQLGTGSNGTVVYAGKWQDRPVAVKRMLRDFYDIASQETRLLREVDRHQNVIQYFAQLERGQFIYIALELCEASLADVMEKPQQFRQLASAGAKDTLAVLKQITKGLDHLHSLQIVHRDLKPQNILITRDRKSGRPRILVSDFGLCKKLEGGQSSFGATTAHAAGTSGWRAPELLLDDETPASSGPMLAESSTHSGNHGSQGAEVTHRRVTRSIDIFSLGIVFFYVLTQGSHPFDCGDKYMREYNIRKGTYSLARLDVLGDYRCEAKHLVGTMISANPKERPKTKEILAHPFFWDARTRLLFLCDVSDAFEREPRDPPSWELEQLEQGALKVTKGDFLSKLHKEFVDSLGKQRKYTGSRLLDLLRALRNKRNHYLDMSEPLQKKVGSLPEGYLLYWTTRFPDLLLYCWGLVRDLGWHELEQFKGYYQPPESG